MKGLAREVGDGVKRLRMQIRVLIKSNAQDSAGLPGAHSLYGKRVVSEGGHGRAVSRARRLSVGKRGGEQEWACVAG